MAFVISSVPLNQHCSNKQKSSTIFIKSSFSRYIKTKKMALEKKHIIPYSMIVVIALLSSCCISIFHDDHYDLQEETGYDFRAFPSLFGSMEDETIYNNSINWDEGIAGLKGLKGRFLASVKTVNVLDFGAKADGRSDDTKAFQNAWNKACSSSMDVNFLVPKSRRYLVKTIRFQGPCKNDITMQIAGTIIASGNRGDYTKDDRHWILFDSVKNLVVQGSGTINGNGNTWWRSSCKRSSSKSCTKHAPTALTFYKCTNLVVKNLKSLNAQQIHISFEKCTNVQASNLVVTAPRKSPNTDGIHITGTQNIQVSSCTIGTGDDCISIVSGSQKVQATNIVCGPGHGISIGSLGSGFSEDYVSDVVVNGAKLSGTTNGVRIKTWQGGSGSASNIKFQNIEMQNVENPIIIDQNYCDKNGPCKEQKPAVQVKNVVYQNIKGTSASGVAVNLNCSRSHPCQGIVLQNVNLVETNGAKAKAACINVNLQNVGGVSPRCL